MQGKFRPDEQNLVEVLSRKVPYSVPKFQREYSWERDKVETFWDDLIINHRKVEKSTTSLENEYYFGAMVFLKERNGDDVILVDGQQRMATVTTLLCVIRDILNSLKNSETVSGEVKISAASAETFVSSFIHEATDEGEFLFWKLSLNVRNREFFRKHVQAFGEPVEKLTNMRRERQKTRSEKNLELAYKFLNDKVTKFQNSYDIHEQPNKLRSLVSRLLNWFAIISIGVETEEDAFDIFETLNERGERLIIGDLVKNMLMKKVSPSERDALDTSWGEIMNNLGGENRRIDQFLTYSWYSRRFFNDGKLSKNTLFKTIKTQTSDENAVLRYAHSLVEDSETYDALTNPEDHKSYWNDDELVHYLSSLKLLGAERTLPPLITGFRKFGEERQEYKEFVRIVLSFFFRFKTFADGSADSVLDHMVNISSFISGLDSTQETPVTCEPWKTEKIKEYLQKQVDSDEKFNHDFAIWSTESSTSAKYVLYELENQIAEERNEELKPISKLTWEHVLPVEFEKHWSEFQDAVNYVDRLGNMTILKGRTNTSIQNKSFSYKKEKAYSQSFLHINQETVNNHEDWTPDIIENRQKDFAERALKIWHF